MKREEENFTRRQQIESQTETSEKLALDSNKISNKMPSDPSDPSLLTAINNNNNNLELSHAT